MATLIHKDPLNALIEMNLVQQEDRGYLGLSQVGHECARSVYYAHKGAPRDPTPPRVVRIWEQGDFQELQIIRDLRAIGMAVTDEQEEIILLGGIVKGHIDGRVLGVPSYEDIQHLLELKSMAEIYFKKFVKEGIKKAHEPYWVQAQLYAHYLGLERILFAAVNKNTEARHFENIPAEPDKVQPYIDRMHEIIAATEAPEKIGGPSYWLCKFFCNYTSYCHGS